MNPSESPNDSELGDKYRAESAASVLPAILQRRVPLEGAQGKQAQLQYSTSLLPQEQQVPEASSLDHVPETAMTHGSNSMRPYLHVPATWPHMQTNANLYENRGLTIPANLAEANYLREDNHLLFQTNMNEYQTHHSAKGPSHLHPLKSHRTMEAINANLIEGVPKVSTATIVGQGGYQSFPSRKPPPHDYRDVAVAHPGAFEESEINQPHFNAKNRGGNMIARHQMTSEYARYRPQPSNHPPGGMGFQNMHGYHQPSFFNSEDYSSTKISSNLEMLPNTLRRATDEVITPNIRVKTKKRAQPAVSSRAILHKFEPGKYHDHVTYPVAFGERKKRPYRGGITVLFPKRLHQMLEFADLYNYSDIVSWQPHGRAFKIHNRRRFTTEVIPKYFRQSTFTSFGRQLRSYGFARIVGLKSLDRGSYFHEACLRGMPDLADNIQLNSKGSDNQKNVLLPLDEPDFYGMPFAPPSKCSDGGGKDGDGKDLEQHFDEKVK